MELEARERERNDKSSGRWSALFRVSPASWDLKLLPEVDSFPIGTRSGSVEAVRFVDL